jgi:parallel beta-helix repeat protein
MGTLRKNNMKNKYIKNEIILLVSLILIFSIMPQSVSSNFQQFNEKKYNSYPQIIGNTLYVGGSGPDNYSSIQAAVNASQSGDTIFVYSNTYYEHVIINKSITLIGENKETTIIDGYSIDNCIKIISDNVVIDSFTLNKGLMGVHIFQSSGHEIKDNIIKNNWEGIGFYQVTNTKVANNSITNNYFEGINPIQSTDNSFSGNKIKWNVYGILLTDSSNNFIYENEINGNTRGIEVLDNSNNNNIYHNNFYASGENNAYDDFSNIWDDDYPSGGNYWDDYSGSDSNDDGIGDTPYNIPGDGNNEDRYPLMEPYIPQYPPDYPFNPYPPHGVKGVDINASLSWNCSDPNGDNLTYDVFFESDNPIPNKLVSNNQSESYYDPPGQMNYSTIYYWKIVAWDSTGASTSGHIWNFTTSSEDNSPPSTPIIEGPMNGKIGVEYEYSFISTDPDEDDLYYTIDWGDGIEETIGTFPSGIEAFSSHRWTKQDNFTIRAKAVDISGAESEWGNLEVIIPKNKLKNMIFINFLNEHPRLFPILRIILGL